MDKIERLFSYYEGNLDDEAENSLFSDLSNDKDLRAEFRAFNSLSTTLPANINSFKPSIDQKSRLFAKAGYTMPIETNVVPMNSTNVVPVKNIFDKLLQNGIIQSIVATFLTVLVMLYFLKDNGNESKNSEKSTNTENIINKNNLPIIESYAADNSNIGKAENKPIVKYIYIDRFVPVEKISDNQFEEENSLQNNSIINDSKIDNLRLGFNNLNTNNDISAQNIPLNDYKILNFDVPNQNFEFSIEQSVPWHIPGETISPEAFSKFNNSAIRVQYRLSDNFKIGGSVEQSTFFTEYEGSEPNGSLYRIRMQPNLTTYSGDVIYSVFDFDKFKPYIQLGLGANTAGFVLKPGAGIEYKFVDNLSFYLSGNYDYFVYSHQDKWFNSQKFRLSYGISYKL